MALAFNKGDINGAINDYFPERNKIVYPGSDVDEAANLALHFNMIPDLYKFQYMAFQSFLELTNQNKDHDEVILEVNKLLLPLQMGI